MQNASARVRGFGRPGVLLCSFLMLWVIFRSVDAQQLWTAVRQMRWGWFLAANLVFITALGCAAARWHRILHISNIAVHSGASTRLTIIGHFFTTTMFGTTGGDAGKALLYSRWFGHSLPVVLSACVLDRLAAGGGSLLLGLVTLLLASTGGNALRLPSPPRLGNWGILTAVAVVVCITLMVIRRQRRQSSIASFLDALRSGMGQLLAVPRKGILTVFFSFCSQLCLSSLLLLCLLGVAGEQFSAWQSLWVFPVISAVTSLPFTFAGAGLREGATLWFLAGYGVQPPEAVAAALLVLLIYLTWATIGGIVLWRETHVRGNSPVHPEPHSISVVLPTLNESASLTKTVTRLRNIPEIAEIIVADGGSTDGTVDLARELKCKVVSSTRGRGLQMRTGASMATGDVILLVHADTWLPPDAGRELLNCLRDCTVVGGGFWKTFRERKLLMAGSRIRCAIRLHLFGRVLGDQVMFIRRSSLSQIGGVPDLPLMEEFALCRGLRQIGRLALVDATATTSARRFIERGILKTYARMWRVTLLHYLGTPPERLARIYDQKRP